MADHTINVCDDWNGSQGNKVTFVNDTDAPCVISQDDSNTWPFKDGPPLPATGSIAPNGGTLVTHLKNPLANDTYTYEVSCCDDQVPKTVTVP
jgi:hypothetical protein